MSRPVRYILGAVVAIVLLAGAFSGGLVIGWLFPAHLSNVQFPFKPVSTETGRNGTPAHLKTLFQSLGKTSNLYLEPFENQQPSEQLNHGIHLSGTEKTRN